MVEVAVMKKSELQSVSRFIAKLNRREDCHIGYCGTNSCEIADTMREEFEVPYWKSFVTVYQSNVLVGVLGFEVDLERNLVEVWGPFVEDQYWSFIPTMWEKMLQLLPEETSVIQMFPNKKNINCVRFAESLGFSHSSEQAILEFNRQSFRRENKLEEISDDYIIPFISLHDQTFSNTYYSGGQIVERLNDTRKVFITSEEGTLTGYIYVEVEPEFGEANIEFFAVDEAFRGRGTGGRLLDQALFWIFTFKEVDTVTLCVNAENQKALQLYERAGFTLVHELSAYSKEI
ncbi:GNAT family N-acetyltransferase [Alkalihalobacillus sp. CinArs1]|uniref:GNAT family N-acetyltransferase n=1 Tax=Alkalihalobacillus sp. CinArs1 TaxID=2995314 RepID=UPI0022DE450B|nr:GNAT family N-acetyltransferase [Alkalihalobacillus sp. CinArs1]